MDPDSSHGKRLVETTIEEFGTQAPMQRPGQPVELAGAYVYLASDESTYTHAAMITVAGGAPNI
ncbi:SDR family oxidoreductase [Luteibacter sp. HA06]